MVQSYFYFNNIPFSYDYMWGTNIGVSECNTFTFRVENFDSFSKLIKRIEGFAELNKEENVYFISNQDIVAGKTISLYWATTLSLCLQLFPILKEERTDGNLTVIKAVYLYIKCGNDKFFKLILTYDNYVEILNKYIKEITYDSLEIVFNFELNQITNEGAISLKEGLVHDGGSFKIYLTMGDEHIENRPHVQCKMDGEMHNISIDDKIEYLGSTRKKEKILNS